MKNVKLNQLASVISKKYNIISTAQLGSDYNIFKDASSLEEILNIIKGGLDEYRDYIYENEIEENTEVIKLYDEGLILIKSTLHSISGKIAEIDSKLEQIS
jgi:hypothetical protein